MKYGSIIYTSITLVILGVLVYCAYQYATDSPYRVSAKKAKQMLLMNKVDVVLDVRTDLERSTLGFYPGSVHIQSADLDRQMANLYPDKNIRILAFCNTGHRARMATDKLHALGYKNAIYISSGYKSIM